MRLTACLALVSLPYVASSADFLSSSVASYNEQSVAVETSGDRYEHSRALQQNQCCSVEGISCFAMGCSLCTGCTGCLGPQAIIFPWCWPCVPFCSHCAVLCTSYLHCAGASWEHCTTPPPSPSPPPPPPPHVGAPPNPSGPDWLWHDGRQRYFRLGPTTCNSPPCPLVMIFHGWLMSTSMMRDASQMDAKVWASGRGGAVVVYPDGTGSGMNSCWKIQGAQPLGGCTDESIDDVGFIHALLDHLMLTYSVDANRVYAMGFSNGGTMTMQLACFMNTRIAAFGWVSPGPLFADVGGGGASVVHGWTCNDPENRLSQGRVPIMHVHGLMDNMALNSPYAVAAESAWASKQGMPHETNDASCTAGLVACSRKRRTRPGSSAVMIYDVVAVGIHAWDMFNFFAIPSPAQFFPTSDNMLNFMWPYRLDSLCPGGGCAAPAPPPVMALSLGCTNSACGDYGNDCCAPGGEPRSCGGGLVVVPGGVSLYADCVSSFDYSAVYQCCPPPPPPPPPQPSPPPPYPPLAPAITCSARGYTTPGPGCVGTVCTSASSTPPPASPIVNVWEVTSGSAYCSLINSGRCVTDGVGRHGNSERCTVRATQDIVASATYFNTESGYDYVTIGGTRYSGISGPSNVAMATGATLAWTADGSVTTDGFTICGESPPPMVSSPSIGSGPRCCGGNDGYCDEACRRGDPNARAPRHVSRL